MWEHINKTEQFMTNLQSPFLKEASQRRFIYQCTNLEGLDKRLLTEDVTFYVGFDATAKSLHVGSLVQIMLIRLAQKHGLRPIILMGGGTTKLGDPADKTEMRKILTDKEIKTNIASLQKTFAKYIRFGAGPTDAIMVNNDEWLKNLNYLKFLREYGPYFTINRMVSFESVKQRLDREQPLTFLEFNYMILQAYDFLELSKHLNCTLQIGGSDQWGNIVNGVELLRRVKHSEVMGLTTPLITTSSGAKMGKTAQGAVWLNDDALSPFDFWQFWRNTDDKDVGRFLRLFTDMPLDKIETFENLPDAEINETKKILADEVTALTHGMEAVGVARAAAKQLFEQQTEIKVVGHAPDGTPKLSSELPLLMVEITLLQDGLPLFELFTQVGLTKSNGEARRLIKGNGARLNDTVISDELGLATAKDLNKDGILKLSAGKKRHAVVYGKD